MFFRKRDKLKKHAKNFDKLVTGIIIGSAIASILGLSRTKKGKQVTQKFSDSGFEIAKKSYGVFGKILVKAISLFDKK